MISPERDVVLVGDPAVALEAKVRLGRVGYDRVIGQLDDPARVFATRPELIETSSRLTIEQLAELRGLEPGLQLVERPLGAHCPVHGRSRWPRSATPLPVSTRPARSPP